MLRPPPKLARELAGINGVPTIVTRSVAHPIKVVGILVHKPENLLQHLQVAPLAVGADKIRLPYTPASRTFSPLP